jgi:branched-chain amino acid transport system permease protein
MVALSLREQSPMSIADAYVRGKRFAIERPFVVLAVVVGVVLFVDLLRRLAEGSLPVSQLGTFLWNGLVVGLSIGLAGIGLSMTYSILNFANFAHGDYVSTGAFVGWAVAWIVAGAGSNVDLGTLVLLGSVSTSELGVTILTTPLAVVLGLVTAAVAALLLSVVLDRVVYRPMRDQEGISLLIASIGVALALRYSLVFVFGQRTRGLTGLTAEYPNLVVDLTRSQTGRFVFLSEPASQIPALLVQFPDGGVTMGVHEIALVVCAAALMAGVHLLLQRTKLGKAMRAMADNEDLARVTGIPTERVVWWTWVIGGGLSGAAGFLITLERGTISFQFGWVLLLLIFAAVILGGIGSVYGAILGGIVMGLASSVSLVWIPSEFSNVAAFGIMIFVLLYRPSGLFSGRATA